MGEREEIAARRGGDLKPNSSSWVSKASGVGDGFIPRILFPYLRWNGVRVFGGEWGSLRCWSLLALSIHFLSVFV